MSLTLRRGLVAALALVALAGVSACATTANCPTGAADKTVYDLNVLQAAFTAEGAVAETSGNLLAARFADVGVVVVVMPMADQEVVRLSTVWSKDPSVVPTVEWLLKINVQNKDGIVKVYLDDDADVVTEWYLEPGAGASAGSVAAAARVFALRSRQVAGELVDYIR